ncbi:MAG: 3'-5' exonuclease [Coriobacteriia bacterium]
MHSAKGLEFNAVYVIHAADGNIPSDMATGSVDEIEEERRCSTWRTRVRRTHCTLRTRCRRARPLGQLRLHAAHPLRPGPAARAVRRKPSTT